MECSMSPLTFSPSRASSNSVSRSEVPPAMEASCWTCSSRRLRSCMSLWLFSGLDQKSGALVCSSILASWDFRAEASKIAPHSVSLLAERSVLSFQFVEGHFTSSLAVSTLIRIADLLLPSPRFQGAMESPFNGPRIEASLFPQRPASPGATDVSQPSLELSIQTVYT